MIKLIECPRDAMQGWSTFISTEQKVEYINALLRVGFDTLDFGSFVSPKAIPQMADTPEVLAQLDLTATRTHLLAIVANLRGAQEAASHQSIRYIGYPFSISETFQRRNTNTGIKDSFLLVCEMLELCARYNKQLVVYISMGFGNPYGDVYTPQIVYDWVAKLTQQGVRIISLADTVGLATAQQVQEVVSFVVRSFPEAETGVHLHAAPDTWQAKVEAALAAGCYRFDGALKGIGGCPMANDELVGNLDTEQLIAFFHHQQALTSINSAALHEASTLASAIFNTY